MKLHELTAQPPQIPHWRWVMYHVMLKRDHPDITPKARRCAKEAFRRCAKKVDAFRLMGLFDLLKHERTPDPVIRRALQIREEPPIRRHLEHLLYEQLDAYQIAEALHHRFHDGGIDVEVVEHYGRLFFDTDRVNAYQMAHLYHDGRIDGERPKPPPVAGKWRPRYLAHQEGLEVEIGEKEMMRQIMADAYFRSAELSELNTLGDTKRVQYMKTALSAAQALFNGQEDGEGLPEHLKVEVTYPADTAIPADQLEGFDPDEADGYALEDDDE